MSTGAWVLGLAVVAALAIGSYRLLTDGRFRGTRSLPVVEERATDSVVGARADDSVVGARATDSVVEERTDDSVVEERADDSVVEERTDDSMVEERAQRASRNPESVTRLAGLDLQLGERATLLQFSSAFCAPCRTTRRTLADVASAVPGVTHVEIDAEQHLDAVRALDVLRTPTTLVLDADGVEVTRASGAPRKEQVLAALGATVSD